MSDIGQNLTWINAPQSPPPLNFAVFWPTGSEKADVMATLHRTANLAPFRATRAKSPCPGASYASSVTEMQLRQALAEAEALLREKDLQIQAVLVWRESAANHLAALTRRQRQVMELVLAGHPSKNIAADLGISQRTVENHRAAIMKRTGSKCLPALARMALAAAWDGPSPSASSAELWNTEGPGFAPTGRAPVDWRDGPAAWRASPGRDSANPSWSSGNGVVAFPGSPKTNAGKAHP
jgi:DNA-binding CsgD family transcriptional regulator